MAFRKDVLCVVDGFDEALKGYAYMEDQDMACRVRKAGYCIWYLPNASFWHYHAPGGRDGARSSAMMKVINSRYILEKNYSPGVLRRTAWWWAMGGMLLAEARAHGGRGVRGVVDGVVQVGLWSITHTSPSCLLKKGK